MTQIADVLRGDGFDPFLPHEEIQFSQVHPWLVECGLTPAEARLANALFGGQSLTESAKTSGISVNTAKSMLKRIFTKCAVHSQPELLLLLSLGPRTM